MPAFTGHTSHKLSVPLIWVNNATIARAGALADFSDDFEKVGQWLGHHAWAILRDDRRIEEIPPAESPGVTFALNRSACQRFGVELDEKLLSAFHRVFT